VLIGKIAQWHFQLTLWDEVRHQFILTEAQTSVTADKKEIYYLNDRVSPRMEQDAEKHRAIGEFIESG